MEKWRIYREGRCELPYSGAAMSPTENGFGHISPPENNDEVLIAAHLSFTFSRKCVFANARFGKTAAFRSTGKQLLRLFHVSLSGCCCSYLEQFNTPARHFCTFVACLPVTPQDSSLHYFLSQSVTMYSIQCSRNDTFILDTNRSCYLLTYFHMNAKSLALSG